MELEQFQNLKMLDTILFNIFDYKKWKNIDIHCVFFQDMDESIILIFFNHDYFLILTQHHNHNHHHHHHHHHHWDVTLIIINIPSVHENSISQLIPNFQISLILCIFLAQIYMKEKKRKQKKIISKLTNV